MREQQQTLHIDPVLRYGNGVATLQDGHTALVPFTLPGEWIEATPGARESWTLLQVREPSAQRVAPECPHFGTCGGCHLQMASFPEQLRLKQDVLLRWLQQEGIHDVPSVQVHAAKPWGYRNRIRLRVGRDAEGAWRFGYNERASYRFLPIRMCPISAPLLWKAAEAILSLAGGCNELNVWLRACSEAELFTDGRQGSIQLLLLLDGKPPARTEPTFHTAMTALKQQLPELTGAGAMLLGTPQRGHDRTRTPATSWGAAGLAYSVGDEHHWVSRGGFFQVNRFLLPELVQLVCGDRQGALAWDLFAGVGLFARRLASSFTQVTAVEGSEIAARDLRTALAKLGTTHRAVHEPTLEFLRKALLQRDRPDLITLDPPRSGAGEDACELLLRLRAPEMVYISCDPETLARDLAVLQRGYRISELHLVDLFPQTFHQETVVVLQRRA